MCGVAITAHDLNIVRKTVAELCYRLFFSKGSLSVCAAIDAK